MAKLKKLDLIGIFQEHGAMLAGHFRLASGMHSSSYIQTALILQYPHIAHRIARTLAAKFPQEIDCVCSPAMGAVIIGQEVARVKKCRAIFAERVSGILSLRREFRIEKGERVLVVEDVLTTGRSTRELVTLAGTYGARVAGVAAIVDRSVLSPGFDVPFRPLLTYPLKLYPADDCELCKRNVPLTTPGSKYLEPSV